MERLSADYDISEKSSNSKAITDIKNNTKKSLIDDLFKGQIKKTTSCIKCSHVDRKNSSFYTLNLNIEKGKSIESTFNK